MSIVERLGCDKTKDMQGYSEGEILRIEKLYGIRVCGDLKAFLIEVGRSFGPLLGDGSIMLYSPAMSIRDHVLYQGYFTDIIINCGCPNVTQRKPFCFSILSETQHFFLFTNSEEPEQVYRYDENNKVVEKTEYMFFDFLEMLIDLAKKNPPANNVVCRGELILF